MGRHLQLFLLLALLMSRCNHSNTGSGPNEPSYCEPEYFASLELNSKDYREQQTKIVRFHAFKVGKVTLAGAAIGASDTDELANLASAFDAEGSVGFCTWYVNTPKDGKYANGFIAEARFNYDPVKPNPKNLTAGEAVEEFDKVLGDQFIKTKPSFFSCLEDHHFLNIGCNAMKHRGPTAFAMLLAFSGCSAQNAAEIANKTWGLNGVKEAVRMAVAQRGYELGEDTPEERLAMQKLFTIQSQESQSQLRSQ